MQVIQVAALYIDPRGPYPGMSGIACWDEKRNAKCYLGPHPVVAHPPCGPWGRLKFLCTKQDPACGRCAVRQVRKYGGVLEHPQHSSLWNACGLPRPGAPPDSSGGYSVEVRQVWWGHVCEKLTWLYIVGTPPHRFGSAPVSGSGGHASSHQRFTRQDLASALQCLRGEGNAAALRCVPRAVS